MIKLFIKKYLLKLVSVCAILLSMGNVQAAQHCTDAYSIDETLASGARWDMCWTQDDNHGIRYHHIYYTPKNGTRRMVLMDAAIAQIHVPYDDNGARYHDVSDYGLGAGYLRSLTASECPGGTLRQYGTKNAVCTQVQKKGAAYRSSTNVDEANVLKVFSISKVGAYVYIPQWLFYDDGRMEPSMLATGALQRLNNSSPQHGWLLDGSRIGVSHMHNYFWRLDFDLNGTATNDVVKEINYNSSGGKRTRVMTTFTSEAARSLSPSKMRSWMISDGSQRNAKNHLMGYEIRLSEAGHREVGPANEAFTYNDFYVTRANSCEQIASHNSRINSGCADSLDRFVNGQSLSGQDLITWVGISFYHIPRSEDYPKMDAHSNHFEIIPRDWHAKNPIGVAAVINAPPVANPDSVNASGDRIVINALSNDTGSGLTLIAPNPWSWKGGQVSLSNNRIAYTAKPGFNGTDKIWYSLKDSQGREAWSVITINVTNNGTVANPFPVGNADTISATAGVLKTIDVLANDIGNGLVLIAPNPWSLKGGSVALVNNKLRYTAKSSYNGEDKIWYTFEDVEGRQAWSVVTINVSGGVSVAPFPIANSDSYTVASNTTRTLNVLSNDTPSGLAIDTLYEYTAQGGRTTKVNGTAVSYTPKAGFTGPDNFWYVVVDSQGRKNSAQVTINVTP